MTMCVSLSVLYACVSVCSFLCVCVCVPSVCLCESVCVFICLCVILCMCMCVGGRGRGRGLCAHLHAFRMWYTLREVKMTL